MNERVGAGVSTVLLEGSLGLARLAVGGTFRVPVPESYRGSWRSIDLEGVHVAEWQTSPITGDLLTAPTTPGAVLLQVAEGSIRYWIGDVMITAQGGSIHHFAGTGPTRFIITEPTRLIRAVMPAALLPPALRPLTQISTTAIQITPVAASLFSVIEAVLNRESKGPRAASGRAVHALGVATLEYLVPDVDSQDERELMLTYIERNLHSQALDPKLIADEFGISLRWAHHVFNVDGSTLARYIRDRRLERVAAQLQQDRHLQRIDKIAKANGFVSRDQLARAFRARYGTTIAAYYSQMHPGQRNSPFSAIDLGPPATHDTDTDTDTAESPAR